MTNNAAATTSPKPTLPRSVRNKIVTAAMVIVFGLPNVVLIWMNFSGYRPATEPGNKGTLVSPQVKLDILGFKNFEGESMTISDLHGKWSLITFEHSTCDDPCMNNVYMLQQIRRAMGVDRARVNRVVFLLDEGSSEGFQRAYEGFKGMELLKGAPRNRDKILKTLSAITPVERGTIFLMDPLGDVMMYYKSGVYHMDVIEDLEHLLKISQIG